MKRVSFIFVILSLALGLQAQTNPKIASLVDKVYSIEGSHVTFVCAYNGTYYESVTVFVESNPDARSFKFANDSITQLTDSLRHLKNTPRQTPPLKEGLSRRLSRQLLLPLLSVL